MSCSHEELDQQGTCLSCGITCHQTTPEVFRIKNSSGRTIMPYLDHLSIPEDVKKRAESVYHTINPATYKSSCLNKLIFFCIYAAYSEMGIPKDPKLIAKIVGIKTGDVSRAMSMFSERNTGYSPPNLDASPLDVIPEYCEKIGLSTDLMPQIRQIGERILSKSPKLLEKSPSVVGATLLLYALTISGIAVDQKSFCANVNISSVTITKMYREITNVDNS